MQVLEVTQRYPPALGGVEIHVAAIAQGLRDRGHTVQISTTDLGRDRPFRRVGPSLPVTAWPVHRSRAIEVLPAPHGLGIVAPGMLVEVLQSRPDVVHAHAFGMAPTWFASLRRRLTDTPLVLEPHLDAGRGTPGWWTYARLVSHLSVRPADVVVAQTRAEAALLAALGVRPNRIRRIPDGIALGEFEDRPQLAAPRESPTVLFVGRLYPAQKGLDPLIRAFARVPPSLHAQLRLVGEDWGGASVVAALARSLGIADRVTMTGPLDRPALLAEYGRADVFVLPSLFEPYGIVLMEAMAAGLPIVASRVGGIPEVVLEGENALLCPPGDTAALAVALERLLREPELRVRFGRRGRDHVRQFSWETVLPQWVDLFESLGRA